MLNDILLIYLLIINLAGFFLMKLDKWKAKRNRWRIKEKHLFLTAGLGGSIGTIAGMYCFRHKTKHKSFVYGMPFILFLQILCLILILYYTPSP